MLKSEIELCKDGIIKVPVVSLPPEKHLPTEALFAFNTAQVPAKQQELSRLCNYIEQFQYYNDRRMSTIESKLS